ncbi:DUF7738 domain-containing protein [Flavobacterium salmonis]|uniref:DUF7738 domain-containing protein n=1 Tax=Flavobacterium salmonis TaxID=2654844 RepID=A0A6V6Z9V2_9FLAO|nr:hypothetical protein [Flavobacterium salmonis]CAD0007692.1 hypothetical protein FLAT13_03987 [Flavobacterium salmonis]
MKILKTIALITFVQLVSCQSKQEKKMETGFVIQDSKLYYNSKEIALGMPIEKFTDAMGMYDRIDIDSSGGFTNRTWHWIKLRGEAYENEENKIIYVNPYIDDEKEKEYNSIEELVEILGKYDSVEEQKSPLLIDKLFIWDKLGISLSAYPETNIVGNIHIQTLHVTKYWELDLGLVKNFEEQNGFPLTKEVKEKRKQDKEHFEEAPKEEYKGNFTYNGNTINLKQIGYRGWDKGVKGLGLGGSDFDPPGDSSTSSRWIKDDYDMYVTLERFSNEEEFEGLSPDKVGKFDCIKSIVIWWHKTND